MNSSSAERALLVGSVMLAVLYAVCGVLMIDGWAGINDGPFGVFAVVAGTLVLTGLWVGGRVPGLGGLLVVGGACSVAIVLWWTILLPAVALLVSYLAVTRARGFGGNQRVAYVESLQEQV